MTRYLRPLTAVVAATAVLGLSGAAAAQTRATPVRAKAATTTGWKVVKSVRSSGTFWDTAASSWWNAWAVGGPGAWRWDGHTWAKLAIPNATAHPVTEVSTSGTGNTWMFIRNDPSPLRRWSSGKWTAPSAAHGAGVVHIAAAGAGQFWATGDGFLRHFDGSAWSDTKLPKDVTISRFAVNHYNDVWAVGFRTVVPNQEDQPYAMHWNGSSWTATTVPAYHVDPGWNSAYLHEVAVLGADDVYAAGDVQTGEAAFTPILVHWNGKAWAKVAVPAWVRPAYGTSAATPVGGGGIWFGWDLRHLDRRTPSGTWTDYKVTTSAGAPALQATAHIPGTTSTLSVGRVDGSRSAVIMLGK